MMKSLTKFKVILPDCNEYLDSIERNAKGRRLIDKICEHVNLKEKEFFSCTFENRKKIRIWLNHDKKIQSQCEGPLLFNFEVKFYPRNPENILDPSARYYLSLQVRQDLLSGRIKCSFNALAVLGSYIAQCEHGDHDLHLHGTGPSYLHGVTLVPDQDEELLGKIAEIHRTHRGMQPYEAETRFLENAAKLSMYGTHLHHAKDGDGIDLTVGISSEGISTNHDHVRINKFSWPKIIKIQYKRDNFYVSPRQEEKGKKVKKLGYKLPTNGQAKRLWRLAKEHHAFFRLRKPESPNKGNLTISRHTNPDLWNQTFDKPHKNYDNKGRSKTTPIATIEDIGDNDLKEYHTGPIGSRYQTISSVDNVKKCIHVDPDASKIYLIADKDGKLRPMKKLGPNSSQNSLHSKHGMPPASPSCYSENSRSRLLHSNPLNYSPKKNRNDSYNSIDDPNSEKILVTKNVCITATSVERPKNTFPPPHGKQKNVSNLGTSYVDHDKELAEAIRSVTEMGHDLAVEKIEITTARIKDPHYM